MAFNGHMNTWGKYYIPSMIYAFQHYDVLNFKDASVQCFSTPYFEQIRDIVDDIFVNKIPVPKPCCKPYNAPKRTTTYKVPPRTDMRQYSNASGGCLQEILLYILVNNLKKISELKAGDSVLTINQKFTKVKCMITFESKSHIVFINNRNNTLAIKMNKRNGNSKESKHIIVLKILFII